MPPWVKLCGNTRLEDCLLAAELRADAVGFIFAPGKRTVTAAQVAAITPHLPARLETIGVFTTRDADAIVEAAVEAGLTGVQLHGPLDLTLLESLRANACTGKLIQVLHWRTDVSAEAQQDRFAENIALLNTLDLVSSILVDSQTAAASGGTGTAFDWHAVAPLLRASRLPVIVAGGLKPETVGDAIAALQPWGVDVSSGVESEPGVKDEPKLRAFLANARKSGQLA